MRGKKAPLRVSREVKVMREVLLKEGLMLAVDKLEQLPAKTVSNSYRVLVTVSNSNMALLSIIEIRCFIRFQVQLLCQFSMKFDKIYINLCGRVCLIFQKKKIRE